MVEIADIYYAPHKYEPVQQRAQAHCHIGGYSSIYYSKSAPAINTHHNHCPDQQCDHYFMYLGRHFRMSYGKSPPRTGYTKKLYCHCPGTVSIHEICYYQNPKNLLITKQPFRMLLHESFYCIFKFCVNRIQNLALLPPQETTNAYFIRSFDNLNSLVIHAQHT